jgi:hypothetical protein
MGGLMERGCMKCVILVVIYIFVPGSFEEVGGGMEVCFM